MYVINIGFLSFVKCMYELKTHAVFEINAIAIGPAGLSLRPWFLLILPPIVFALNICLRLKKCLLARKLQAKELCSRETRLAAADAGTKSQKEHPLAKLVQFAGSTLSQLSGSLAVVTRHDTTRACAYEIISIHFIEIK